MTATDQEPEKMNVNCPVQFNEKLQKVMSGIYELFESVREHELNTRTENGSIIYFEDAGKRCNQVTKQYDRPTEFLQSLLDIIRVNFDPNEFRNILLNSNMHFLYNEIHSTPFQLGYVSITSENDQNFDSFWNNNALPYIEKCGYNIEDASAIFLVGTSGSTRHFSLFEEVMKTFRYGFSSGNHSEQDETKYTDQIIPPTKQIYSGYCRDDILDNKIRLSVWMFIQGDEQIDE